MPVKEKASKIAPELIPQRCQVVGDARQYKEVGRDPIGRAEADHLSRLLRGFEGTDKWLCCPFGSARVAQQTKQTCLIAPSSNLPSRFPLLPPHLPSLSSGHTPTCIGEVIAVNELDAPATLSSLHARIETTRNKWRFSVQF